MLCGEDLSKFRTSIGNIINDICTTLCINGVVFCTHYIPMSRSLTPKAFDFIFIQWSLAELGCLCNGSATSTPKTVTRFVNLFLCLLNNLNTFFLNYRRDPVESRCTLSINHDYVIKWKHVPRNWPFLRGIHQSPVHCPLKASDAELWCFLWSEKKTRLIKQSKGCCHRAHYDVIVMSIWYSDTKACNHTAASIIWPLSWPGCIDVSLSHKGPDIEIWIPL